MRSHSFMAPFFAPGGSLQGPYRGGARGPSWHALSSLLPRSLAPSTAWVWLAFGFGLALLWPGFWLWLGWIWLAFLWIS